MKQIIRLTEGDLHRLVVEVVNNILGNDDSLSPDAIVKLIYDTTGIQVGNNNISEGRFTSSNPWDDIEYKEPVPVKVASTKKSGGENAQSDVVNTNGEVQPTDNSETDTTLSYYRDILVDYFQFLTLAKEKWTVDGRIPTQTMILHDVYSNLCEKYGVDDKEIRRILKIAFSKFEGIDKRETSSGKVLRKGRKPLFKFPDSVMSAAWRRVRDGIERRQFEKDFGEGNGIVNQMRRGQADTVGETDDEGNNRFDFLSDDADAAYDSVMTKEFRDTFDDLLYKYLDNNNLQHDALIDYYSGIKITEIARKYNTTYPRAKTAIKQALNKLRSSVDFKNDVAQLLDDKYDAGKVKKLGMSSYVSSKNANYNIKDDYTMLIRDAYKKLNKMNSEPSIKIPDDRLWSLKMMKCYTKYYFIKLFTKYLIPDFSRYKQSVKKKKKLFLSNLYDTSYFKRKWETYIEENIQQNETNN